MITVLKPIAFDVILSLSELYDYYLYAVSNAVLVQYPLFKSRTRFYSRHMYRVKEISLFIFRCSVYLWTKLQPPVWTTRHLMSTAQTQNTCSVHDFLQLWPESKKISLSTKTRLKETSKRMQKFLEIRMLQKRSQGHIWRPWSTSTVSANVF